MKHEINTDAAAASAAAPGFTTVFTLAPTKIVNFETSRTGLEAVSNPSETVSNRPLNPSGTRFRMRKY